MQDAVSAGVDNDKKELDRGGRGAMAYADAVSTYLALAVSRNANTINAHAVWSQSREQTVNLFSRQAIPMTWDFPEVNPFAGAAGDFGQTTNAIAKSIAGSMVSPVCVYQADAQKQSISKGKVVSTDPPYYDNVAYADLSDFFYAWLRPSLKEVFPEIFATVTVPKKEELVASPTRHGSKENAEAFFLDGMEKAMRRLAELSNAAFPLSIYYAFKQSETTSAEGTKSTGWETFLEGVIRAGFSIVGTWPMRTERPTGVKSQMNALASSVVLICRPRSKGAETISRRALIRELNKVLPEALDEMTRGSGDDRSPVAPVDLSQAMIGPGMAVFSKYAAVLEADGSKMTVQSALELINRFLAEDDFDHDTQFCLHWFEQFGWKDGRFGEADTLARAKGTSVDGVKQAGVLFASGGVVRLLKWMDYPSDWDVDEDERLPIWEALHHLIRVFKSDGESAAGKVLATLAAKAEATRQLAYRLYTLCERSGWAEDARAYNEIVTSWSAIESAAAAAPKARQSDLFE
jgi:putative DNA methylase